MAARRMLYPTLALAAAAIAGTPGCEGREQAPPAATHDVVAPMAMVAAPASDPEIARWLDGLKAATAPFRDTAVAAAAGWSTKITGCLAMPDSGGMGLHFGNTKLIDGEVQQFKPELLVYAPVAGGGLRLVAVEYIVPFSIRPPDARPPKLHGVEFHRNFTFNLWALHAWIWQPNPRGVFANWNPEVSCNAAR